MRGASVIRQNPAGFAPYGILLFMITTFEASIFSRTIIADNTVEVVFDVSKRTFNFTAGQYITVTVHGLEALDIREQFRDFSIASSPDRPEKISIAFRVSQSRFKQSLLDARIGAPVTISGPKGIFTIPETAEKPIIFIAGGIGITPFLSMLRIAKASGLYRITLFYYNGNKESAAYRKELESVAKQNDAFDFCPVYGYFDGNEIKKYIVKHAGSDFLFYIAGPPGMVASARWFLDTNGIQDKNIKTEEFSGYGTND